MADNYLQFSTNLELQNDEERMWWKRRLDFDYEEAKENPVHFNGEEPVSAEAKLFKRLCLDDDHECWDFEYTFHNREDNSLIFYAEECGSPGAVAELVHNFYKDMRPDGDDVFIITWACTCSKMRLNEFDGGTAVATKNGVGWCGVDDQVEYAKNNIKLPE